MPTGETRYVEGIRKKKKVDRDELLLRLKSNRLRLRPRSERHNHGNLRAQDPNVEEIMISGKKIGASTPKVDMK